MKNIVLTGMPGSGKSTVGVILAKTLGYSFTDTDLIIQERSSRLLQDIVDNDGIEAFIALEEEAILSINSVRSVIATGGSAIYSERAMNKLKESGTVIFLDIPTETLCKRLYNINTRGIAMKKGQSIRELMKTRHPLYEKHSDIIIKTNGETVEETVDIIIKNLNS